MTYKIANICFSMPDEFITGFLTQALSPFRVEDVAEVDFELSYCPEVEAEGEYHQIESFDFAEAEAKCSFGRDEHQNYILKMYPHEDHPTTTFRISDHGSKVVCNYAEGHLESILRFGLWIAYNIVAVQHHIVAIHSSVIVYKDQAILMLGESGTGKSTQTRLWRTHIEGARLLNDDSPIVCARTGDCAEAYGSAWSGKTPCYLNAHVPIRAFVRLSQAPHNKIRKLSRLESIGALLPSCPLAFSHDKYLFDFVCGTVSAILKHTDVYHLECLPNKEAAELTCKTLFEDEINR